MHGIRAWLLIAESGSTSECLTGLASSSPTQVHTWLARTCKTTTMRLGDDFDATLFIPYASLRARAVL